MRPTDEVARDASWFSDTRSNPNEPVASCRRANNKSLRPQYSQPVQSSAATRFGQIPADVPEHKNCYNRERRERDMRTAQYHNRHQGAATHVRRWEGLSYQLVEGRVRL